MNIEIKTIGCRQNQYESAVLRNIFISENPFNLHGDVIIINGCSVTSKATRDTRKIIRKAKSEGKNIVVTGCLADKTITEDKDILFINNATKHKLIYGQSNYYQPALSRPLISVETGCDEFCSYCIVPYLRGKPIVRDKNDIEKEIEFLISKGFFEFVLTGTNIAIAIKTILRILDWAEKKHNDIVFRLSSLDPAVIKDNIEIFTRGNVAHTAHLSLQSLSDDTLKEMKRRHTVKDIYQIIEELLRIDPLFAIGGDLILGFPTEGKREFEETKKNIINLPVSYLHIFEYSPREGTLAGLYKNKFSNRTIKEHTRELHKIIDGKKREFKKKNIGNTLRSTLLGNNIALTTNYLNVKIPSAHTSGNIVNIKIEGIKEEELYGKIA